MEIMYKERIGVVHSKHRMWVNELLFYKDELIFFQKRLEEIAVKNTSKHIHIQIEQFQNRFIIQRDEIDKLEHLINVNEDEAVYSGSIHVRRISYEATDQFIFLEKEIEQFEKLFEDLKNDFYKFLSMYL